MSKNIQATYYLTETEHKKFKVKCIMDNTSMTEKIRELIKKYLEDTNKKDI